MRLILAALDFRSSTVEQSAEVNGKVGGHYRETFEVVEEVRVIDDDPIVWAPEVPAREWASSTRRNSIDRWHV